MKAITAVGHVSCPDVLTCGKKVIDSQRQQRAERNLKRPSLKIDVVIPACSGMEIDRIASDPDCIPELLSTNFRLWNTGDLRTRLQSDMLFQNGKLRANAARLASIRIFRNAG